MAAAAITGGDVLIEETSSDLVLPIIDKMMDAGVKIESTSGGTIRVQGPDRLLPVNVSTRPYPGFPTDMQAQFMAMMCVADGVSVITENIFENRFMHALELMRMGAEIKIEGNAAFVRGVQKLTAADVMATDLRASASLLLAGLVAEGETTVRRIYHLWRGYEKLVEKLSALGADVRPEQDDEF
jgi:UDP-N-acetylglucosamine 1-carboxyvinyltransferase